MASSIMSWILKLFGNTNDCNIVDHTKVFNHLIINRKI